jgi:hypothetical protein
MQPVSNSGHAIRELARIRDQGIVVASISAFAPAVVEHYIVIPQVFESVVDNQLCGLEKEVLGDVAAQSIPIVP